MEGSFEGGSSVLPDNQEDQLNLGMRMVQNAFNGKVQRLEQELHQLKLGCEDSRTQSTTLQRKNSSLESELVDSHQRSQQLAEENKELFKSVSQLRRQLSRLEGLKRRVVDSIQDHGQPNVDEEPWRATVPMEQLTFGSSRPSSRPMSPRNGGASVTVAEMRDTELRRPMAESQARPAPPPPPPAQEPVADMKFDMNGNPVVAPIDGKQFFRQARNSLDHQAFNEFLGTIKRLNNQQQTREETLDNARQIFGPERHNLYMEFEQLLQRQGL